MHILIWIILATIIDSLTALGGVVTLWMSQKKLQKLIFILIAFSAGALLGGGFFHLLPESFENMGTNTALYIVMVGFIAFFIMEKLLYWHHCHEGKCDVHPFSYLILIGDSIHNFVDGLIIAASFFVSMPFGVITTLMVISHEVPQELGNFGVLVYGGFKRTKALFYNFIAQASCVLGGVIGYFASGEPRFTVFILPFAAGGFIYIAASDLVPELHDEKVLKKSIMSFAVFILGLIFMIATKMMLG